LAAVERQPPDLRKACSTGGGSFHAGVTLHPKIVKQVLEAIEEAPSVE
jgi:hypothetical protein